MRIRVCWYKNAGVAGYAEAFRPVQSDSQTSEWYSYFENDVPVIHPSNTNNSVLLILCNGGSYQEQCRIMFFCRNCINHAGKYRVYKPFSLHHLGTYHSGLR